MTAKTWDEVFTRLDAFFDEFSADVRAVADVDGADEAEVRSLRTQLDDAQSALEAAEAEVARLRKERDEAESCCGCEHGGHHVLPTPDYKNPAHLQWAADVADGGCAPGTSLGISEFLRDKARRLEAERVASEAAEDALVEKAARAIHDSDEHFPPKEWGARSEALRNNYRANARALLAAGLLADGGDKA